MRAGGKDVPVHILCFVDLCDISQGFNINGYRCHDNGLYAVVEATVQISCRRF
jgi:hypothetical protein